MKRIFLILIAIATAGITTTVLSGCYKDVVNPGENPNAPPQDISFNVVLKPLFEKNCAQSGCHDATPAHKPSLVPEKSFNALVQGGYVNLIFPDQSSLYVLIKGGSMPPTAPLSSSQVKQVLDWIKNGAKNN
jgi:hypothetical protein